MISTRPAGTVCADPDGRPGVCDGFTVCEVGQSPCDVEGATTPCYTGPAGTSGVAHCSAGLRTCERNSDGALFFGQCLGQQLPRVEECNAVDDDCNGMIDDFIPTGRLSDYLQGTVPPGQPRPRLPMHALCRLRTNIAGPLSAPHDNAAFIEVDRVEMPPMNFCGESVVQQRAGVMTCRDGSFICEAEPWWDFCAIGVYDTPSETDARGSISPVRAAGRLAAQAANRPADADPLRSTTCGLGPGISHPSCNVNCYGANPQPCNSREACAINLICLPTGSCDLISQTLNETCASSGRGGAITCWTWSASDPNTLGRTRCMR